jgi:mannose-1-phosphate guanylyltransferase
VKAFLLAAVIGSRLRRITATTPKCTVEIDDRPLLDIWLDAFTWVGVDQVLVNLHHVPDIVRRHVAARTGPREVHLVFEPELLGSADTLLTNRQWVADESFFLASNADNLTDFELRDLIDVTAPGTRSPPLRHSIRRTRRPAVSWRWTRLVE